MRRLVAGAFLLAISATSASLAQSGGPAKDHDAKGSAWLNFGDDYQLANYKQIEVYWKTLGQESDRMVLHDMGKIAEGRTEWMAIVTSSENHTGSQ